MNLNFKGQTIELNNSVFLNEKIANLVVKKGILFEEKNNLFFQGQVDFKINDINLSQLTQRQKPAHQGDESCEIS